MEFFTIVGIGTTMIIVGAFVIALIEVIIDKHKEDK